MNSTATTEKNASLSGIPASSGRQLQEVAHRAETEGPLFESAILQLLREQLWEKVRSGRGSAAALKVLPMLLRARQQANTTKNERDLATEAEEQAALHELLYLPQDRSGQPPAPAETNT